MFRSFNSPSRLRLFMLFAVAYFTCSISPGFQVFSNQGWSGPLRRSIVFQPLPGTVCTKLAWSAGAAGPNPAGAKGCPRRVRRNRDLHPGGSR